MNNHRNDPSVGRVFGICGECGESECDCAYNRWVEGYADRLEAQSQKAKAEAARK